MLCISNQQSYKMIVFFYFYFLVFVFLLFWDNVSLCRPNLTQNWYPSASPSWVLKLQAYTTTTCLIYDFEYNNSEGCFRSSSKHWATYFQDFMIITLWWPCQWHKTLASPEVPVLSRLCSGLLVWAGFILELGESTFQTLILLLKLLCFFLPFWKEEQRCQVFRLFKELVENLWTLFKFLTPTTTYYLCNMRFTHGK